MARRPRLRFGLLAALGFLRGTQSFAEREKPLQEKPAKALEGIALTQI